MQPVITGRNHAYHETKETPPSVPALSSSRRAVAVIASIFIMCCSGSVYAWSIFVAPLRAEFGLSSAQTQLIFGFIIASFTITMLFVGRIEIRLGPKKTAAIGAVLFSAGYLLASFSGGSFLVILAGVSVISGAGMGFGYVTVLTTLVKWFPGHKGLATGIAVAGFGSGAILLSQVAQPILKTGMAVTEIFRYIGILYGVLFLVCALFISAPVPTGSEDTEKPLGPGALARDKRFWVLFYTFFAGSFAGLLLIGNLKPLGLHYGISESSAVLAIVLVSIGNAAGRIFWGQVYDKIGGKSSVGIGLALCSVFILILAAGISSDIAFLLLCLVIGLTFGCNFVLYASEVSQIYGISQLGIVYPIVSIAYGISGIVGPLAGGYLFDITGQYYLSIVLSVAICLTGLVVHTLFIDRAARPGRQPSFVPASQPAIHD